MVVVRGDGGVTGSNMQNFDTKHGTSTCMEQVHVANYISIACTGARE